jgi:predicted NBD/HSP70 family sugar kinase
VRIERNTGLRDTNRSAILELIRDRGTLSRADLARLSGLSPSTVTAITADLLTEGLLVEDRPLVGNEGQPPIGRPATPLRLDPSAGHAVGIKLGPDALVATVTDLDAEPLAMARVPHGASGGAASTSRVFRALVDEVVASAGIDAATLVGLGIGVPGVVDPTTGKVTGSFLSDWVEHDLRDLLAGEFGLPVLIDNDVNTLTIAEHLFGAGRGVADLVVVTVGRGIGMGVIANGRIARGWRGGTGEIGHLVVRQDGPRCWCGRQGCLEALAAEPALVREVLAVTGRLVAPGDLAGLAEQDPRVAALLDRAGTLVGEVLRTVTQLLDPQRIVLSGEGVRLGARFLDALRTSATATQSQSPDLVIEPWGDEAWARGAATLVLREFFHPAHLRDEPRPPAVASAPRRRSVPRQAQRGQRR